MTAEATSTWHRLWHTRWRDLARGNVDGSLNWRALVAAEDLPANVRSLIEQVVGRTRLWRSEKVDVAREIVAHFQDGLEAGASSEQLIESFGDPRQAAKLIGRAKRRGRSLLWQFWHWACLAFGVVRGAVCERPDRYLFWDGEHPTRAGHRIIARAAFHVLAPAVASCE